MTRVQCSKCEQIFKDDYEFEIHECPEEDEGQYDEIDSDLLRAVAWGDMSEEAAWAKQAERRASDG